VRDAKRNTLNLPGISGHVTTFSINTRPRLIEKSLVETTLNSYKWKRKYSQVKSTLCAKMAGKFVSSIALTTSHELLHLLRRGEKSMLMKMKYYTPLAIITQVSFIKVTSDRFNATDDGCFLFKRIINRQSNSSETLPRDI